MEIKNFFAQDSQGNIMPSADCYLYLPDTTNLATGLVNADGLPISNPFKASLIGQVQFGAPNGVYDLRIARGVRDTTIRIQCADLLQSINEISAFLGPHASAPTTRNDGSPLQLADRYLNTTDQNEYIYKSAGWENNNIDSDFLATSQGASFIGAVMQDGSIGTVQQAIELGDVSLRQELVLVGPTVTTLAALKAIDPAGVRWGRTLGRNSTGDGGGAFWAYNAASTETADDVVYVMPDSGVGRWVLNNPGHINMRQAGCVGNGSTVDSAAMSKGHLAADKLGVRCYYPAGTYLTNQAVQAPTRGAFGDSSQSTFILCEGVSAFTFPITLSLGRSACIIERICILPKGDTCLAAIAINIPGVASGAANAYLSGLTIRDCVVGGNGNRFNIGIHAKDIFLLNVSRVNMTNVNNPFYVVGSVVQATFRDSSCYNTGVGVGFTTVSALYAGNPNPMGPEHITAADLSLISFERGLYHSSGSLMITFNNIDIQASRYGMFLSSSCYISGGIILADSGVAAWQGINIPTFSSSAANGIVIRDIEINAASTTPGNAFMVSIGNAATYIEGIVLSGLRMHSGIAGGLNNAIFGSRIGSLVIENCMINQSAFIANTINLTQVRRVTIRGNMLTGNGSIAMTDDGETSSGSIEDNPGFATVGFTPTTPANWSIARTGTTPYPSQSPYGASTQHGWSPAAVAAGAVTFDDFPVPGAAPGDTVILGFSGQTGNFTMELSGYVTENGTVRAIIRNSTAGSLALPSGTLTIKVFK